MNTDDRDTGNPPHGPQPGTRYALGQLAQALTTALAHEDEPTRQRAQARIARWRSVLAGIAKGTLTVGSRSPVAGLPAWVTPEVVHGGFATGAAAAGGPLREDEIALAHRAGIPLDRRALFAHHLTDQGLDELLAMLDSRRYRIDLPEQAGLAVIAWLARSGDRSGALALVETLGPFAAQLRFAPTVAANPAPDPSVAWRATAGEVRAILAAKRANERVEAMREAVEVWSPFADRLLEHWLDTAEDGRIAARTPSAWLARSAALLGEYRELATRHTRCTKHRKPRENLAVLRAGLETVAEGRDLPDRQRALVQRAADGMVRRRGRPGSATHSATRARQSAEGPGPAHYLLARVVAARLAVLPQDAGIADPAEVTHPVGGDVAGIAAGTPVPPSVRRVAERARQAPVEELVKHGIVGSAEVLAQLTPQIAAEVTALPYPDPALRALMAAHYRAFRSRRSLLLLDLEHQVQLAELPWVRAVAGVRRAGAETEQEALAVLRRLGSLTLEGFPGTALPNPMIRELGGLAAEAGLALPWVEELAADIFMGTFSVKFLRAAKIAADLLHGTLYERYYGIDYQRIRGIDDVTKVAGLAARTSSAFDQLCAERAGSPSSRRSVAANGTVIEQAQILTTHNLATLAGPAGVRPAEGWLALAQRAFGRACTIAGRLGTRPLAGIKDTAYAWRQMLFFLSLCDEADQHGFLRWAEAELAGQRPAVRERLRPAVTGLGYALAGGSPTATGPAGQGRRLLGWTTTTHWMQRP